MPANASAQDWTASDTPLRAPVLNQSAFIFGSTYYGGDIVKALDPFNDTYNGDLGLGVGYQNFLWSDPTGFSFGFETGIAGRVSNGNLSADIWGGVVGRYDGFVIADTVRVSPAFTFGLSYVTGKVASEVRKEAKTGDSADLLFYLGPEINFSFVDAPDLEVFGRVHHRSGAWGTLANMDGSNASAIGIRKRF